MKKLAFHLKKMNSLSLQILKLSILVWSIYILSYTLLRITYANSQSINLTLACCVEAYPLLIFMSLALSVVGAILIDIYAKTQQDQDHTS